MTSNEPKKKKRTLAQQKADLDARFEVDRRSGLVRASLDQIRSDHHHKHYGAAKVVAKTLLDVLTELEALTSAPAEQPAQQELSAEIARINATAPRDIVDNKTAAAGADK